MHKKRTVDNILENDGKLFCDYCKNKASSLFIRESVREYVLACATCLEIARTHAAKEKDGILVYPVGRKKKQKKGGVKRK